VYLDLFAVLSEYTGATGRMKIRAGTGKEEESGCGLIRGAITEFA
jgi:hypothetical protein